jgi:hypothetical protein
MRELLLWIWQHYACGRKLSPFTRTGRRLLLLFFAETPNADAAEGERIYQRVATQLIRIDRNVPRYQRAIREKFRC